MKNRAFDESKYQNWIDPAEVKPYERNAKLHPPEQIKAIVDSIKRFGWQQDTVITADNVLVIGHGRRLAALEIGCKLPYHRVGKNADELTDEDIKALRLADNKVAESGFDFGKMTEEMADIPTVDMSVFKFGAGGLFHVEEPAEPYDDEYENEILETRRVIITYLPEQEQIVKDLLGVEDDLRPIYRFEDLKGDQEE